MRWNPVPAALYKVLGGFATNGINLTKLESYISGKNMKAARFYVDAEGHPHEKGMQKRAWWNEILHSRRKY